MRRRARDEFCFGVIVSSIDDFSCFFPRFANNALSRMHIDDVYLHVASFTSRVLSNVRPESLYVCSFNCLLI